MIRTRIEDFQAAVQNHANKVEELQNEFRNLLEAHKIQVSENELGQITAIGQELYNKLAQVVEVVDISLGLKTTISVRSSKTVDIRPVRELATSKL